MNAFITWLTDVGGQLGNWLYVILAAIAFLEALPLVGFFIPGVIALLVGGFLVSQGFLNFPNLLIIVAVSALFGDCLAFAIGRRFSASFKKDHPLLKLSYLEAAQKLTKRWGKASLFIGRFFSSVRSMISVVVGIANMSWFDFCLRAALGSLLFSFVYLGLGYLAGNAWQTIASWSSRAVALIAGMVVVFAFLWWLKGFLVKQGRELKLLAANILRTAWQSLENRLPPFLKKIFNPSQFFGLPLLSLSALVLLLLIFIYWLAATAPLTGSLWANFDQRISSFLGLFLNAHIGAVAFLITALGFAGFLSALSVAFTFWLFLEKRKSYIAAFWTGLLGSLAATYFLKFIIARPRPEPLFYFENSYAFPSTHAVMALFFSFFIVYYAIRAYPRWSRNVSIIFIAIIVTVLIGWSRLYLGVHHLADVLGGYALGGIWLIMAIITERRLSNLDKPQRQPKLRQAFILSGLLIFLAVIYISQTFNKTTIQDLSQSLPQQTIARGVLSDILSSGRWPLRTENLRGGWERPITFIFKADQAVLLATLQKTGWLQREEPTVGTVLKRGSAIIFKVSYPTAPLRPRFWRNEPTELTFTKEAPVAIGKDAYVLRLWSAPLIDTDKLPVFVVEVWVNRDLPLPLPVKESILKAAKEQLLADVLSAPSWQSRVTLEILIPNNIDELEEGSQILPIEVITLR